MRRQPDHRLRRVPPGRSRGIPGGLSRASSPRYFCRSAPLAVIKGDGRVKLYTYYRSQASFRVRIALNLKGIAREDAFLHLEKGDKFAAAYRGINPQIVG